MKLLGNKKEAVFPALLLKLMGSKKHKRQKGYLMMIKYIIHDEDLKSVNMYKMIKF